MRRATILGNPCAGCPAISIHALLAESDCITTQGCCQITHFYPRSPCGERLLDAPPNSKKANFYPRSPCGERLSTPTFSAPPERFLSTLSLRRATACSPTISSSARFLSTLSLRRATRSVSRLYALFAISIHALLAESDTGVFVASYCVRLFLSTLSLRRATHLRSLLAHRGGISIHALLAESDANGRCARIVPGISIHALLAESDPRCRRRRSCQAISIHALLAESDLRSRCRYRCTWPFLSTLSLRRATTASRPLNAGISDFYPRSPCGERPHYWHPAELRSNFYPRSPCGERRAYRDHDCYNEIFLSTLSLRRATHKHGQLQQGHVISIHALLAESDLVHVGRVRKDCYFYPRSPCGERPPVANLKSRRRNFYPRSPCGERRGNSGTQADPAKSISIHALLAESDAPRSRDNSMGRNISIHALLAESDLHCQL